MAVISIFPSPSIIRLPKSKTGSESTDFFMYSESPVKDDSSIVRSFPSIKMPSKNYMS
jgi:hypothetical protein